MVVRPGAIIGQMPNATCMHLHGIQRPRAGHMKLVEVVQHGARMADRPGNVSMMVVTAIIPGPWRLIMTIPIAGLSRHAPGPREAHNPRGNAQAYIYRWRGNGPWKSLN